MIVVLLSDDIELNALVQALSQTRRAFLFFNQVDQLEAWLSTNPLPQGLVIDIEVARADDFLLHTTLLYPELPCLSVNKQSRNELTTQLLAFKSRLENNIENCLSGNILLIEHSRASRLQHEHLLKNAGFNVEVADSTSSGLLKASKSSFDLILLDYFMPDKNAAEICLELLQANSTANLPVVILISEYQQEIVEECLQAGATDCLFTNQSTMLLLVRINTILASHASQIRILEEKNRLKGLLYSLSEGAFGVNAEGRIQFVNPAALKILGQTKDELLGQYPHECIHPIDNIGRETTFAGCFLQQAYGYGDELKDWRTLFKRADGSIFPVECSVSSSGNGSIQQCSIVVFHDMSEQLRLEKNWQWQLSHDAMTGLLNRSAFEEILESELSRIRRTEKMALLLFIDLDNFKIVNDQFGHAAGDQLLISLAKNLSERTRETDYVGRYAGDEFVVLLTGICLEQIAELANNYRLLLQETRLVWQGQKFQVTGSIGLVVADQFADSMGELMAQADRACHQAKIKGRNQWALYNASCKQTEQGNWYVRLTEAMQQQNFILLQQPIFSANNIRQPIGSHCLLRLSENNTLISPALFMSNAKRFGVIKNIDLMVVQQFADYCRENKPDPHHCFLISLSMETIVDEKCRNQIIEIWRRSKLIPGQLKLDLNEDQLYQYTDWQKYLTQLRNLGIEILISHFGMNSQALLSMPQMPIDAVKLDSALTREVSNNSARSHLLDAIVKTAHDCNIQIFASHIESAQELAKLIDKDIDYLQGFYLGRPTKMQSPKPLNLKKIV